MFDLTKLRRGIERACEKRPVSSEKIEEIVDEIQLKCISMNDTEIESSVLGRMVMDRLRKLDEVAYARFSCVYHEFKDLKTFVNDLEKLIQDNRGKAD
jgi:transcriptional repressor NrdR